MMRMARTMARATMIMDMMKIAMMRDVTRMQCLDDADGEKD